MATTNQDLLVTALNAPVEYLAADTKWTDLGINEFWAWLGQVLPEPDGDERIASDRLPALVAEIAGASKADERTVAYDVIVLDIEGALIYPAQSGTNQYPAATCLQAIMTLQDVLTSSEARRTLWGAPSAVAGFDFSFDGLGQLRDPDDSESVAYVIGRWSMRIDQIMPHAQ